MTEPHGTVAFSAARTLLQRLATTSILAPVDLTPCTIEALDRMLAHTTRHVALSYPRTGHPKLAKS